MPKNITFGSPKTVNISSPQPLDPETQAQLSRATTTRSFKGEPLPTQPPTDDDNHRRRRRRRKDSKPSSWLDRIWTRRSGGQCDEKGGIFRVHSTSTSTSHPPRPKDNGNGGTDDDGQSEAEPRRIYFNQPLPRDMLSEDGSMRVQFARNKVRTAKYTPLSFVPKNLALQFQNVANIYFLFVIILNFFSIFGSANPGLNATPLIAIVAITAIKDAVEDGRRTILDNELNNSPIHRLADWHNVNSAVDDVSLWRRFKKACTRAIVRTYRRAKEVVRGPDPIAVAAANDDRRGSVVTKHASVSSFDAMELTPVSSPVKETPTIFQTTEFLTPDFILTERRSPVSSSSETTTATAIDDKSASTLRQQPQRDGGSVLNKEKSTPGTARFIRDAWKNVQVGDFVRIYRDDQIPADVVVLSSSDDEGSCYVETKNLDGETNLKVRQAMRCGAEVRHARDCEKAEFQIESEAPHPNLYQYNGAMKWRDADGEEMVEPITANNLLLRGCSLRNTEWVLGVVVFTGFETKIMLNSGETPRKRPRMMRALNWNVVYNFILLFLMCFFSGTVQGVTWAHGRNTYKFFEYGTYGGTPATDGFVTFWAAVILFQNLVPISLYITLEIVRTMQALFIFHDIHMYYAPLDYPCTPKSWNISDDLGQIEYIFSDKTGTLTQNVMEFRKCTINGVAYGEAFTEAQAGMQRRNAAGTGATIDDIERAAHDARAHIARTKTKMLHRLRNLHDNPYLHDDALTFVSDAFVADIAGARGDEQAAAVEQFMLALALCHTVIAERSPGDPPRVEFKAQSPDEAALVATARDCGFTVLGRSGKDDVRVSVMGAERVFRVLKVLEFNSARKRMSVVVRMPPEYGGRIMLFCKGADSIVYSRLKARDVDRDMAELKRTTAAQLEVFAREGLRTLCVAQRELGEEEYADWSRRHEEAASALVDREQRLEEVSSEIESELVLLGGTAIEDRLQDGVPDTISLLAKAGIKLWVLTGDKVETAINIGFSCNLLSNDMDLILLDAVSSHYSDDGDHERDSMAEAQRQLDAQLHKFGLTGSKEELLAARKDHEPPTSPHAVVVDGDTLKLLLRPELKQKFLILCKQCKAVLCCRVSPAQKAAVVEMVRDGLDIMALSIGDGANDVAMIQKADVGVGIVGEEGRQAAMSSDYAIGQFKYLQRLLLVHGRWSYRRMAECTANFFYKNIVWTFALFWYSIYNNFDCSYLFDYTYIVLVNLVFTSLPVIFVGIFDQDVSDKVSLAVPQLYRRGIERLEWTELKFWLYMIDGLYQSVICFFSVYCAYYRAQPVSSTGRDISDRARIGVCVACSAVLVSNTYVLLNTYRWDWLTVVVNLVSSLSIWAWTGIFTSFTVANQFYKAAEEVFGAATYWALLLLTVVLCLTPRTTLKSLHKVYRPLDVDVIREQVQFGQFKYLDAYEGYIPPTAGMRGNDESKHPPSGADLRPRPSTAASASSDPFSNDQDHAVLTQQQRQCPAITTTTTITQHQHRIGRNGEAVDEDENYDDGDPFTDLNYATTTTTTTANHHNSSNNYIDYINTYNNDDNHNHNPNPNPNDDYHQYSAGWQEEEAEAAAPPPQSQSQSPPEHAPQSQEPRPTTSRTITRPDTAGTQATSYTAVMNGGVRPVQPLDTTRVGGSLI